MAAASSVPVVNLLSDDARHITGAVFSIDGGRTATMLLILVGGFIALRYI